MMLKKYVLIYLGAISVVSCHQPERDCTSYKTGEFQFEYEIGDTLKTGRFVRDDNYSVDYYENKIDSATVRWLNDCEFVLQDKKNNVGIHYKIISTTDSSYTFQYKNAVRDINKKLIVKTGTAYKTD